MAERLFRYRFGVMLKAMVRQQKHAVASSGKGEETEWVRAAGVAELRGEGRLMVRHQGRQIALFQTEDGVLACNNRCPHEGYPLVEGTLDRACTLTCNWHNWKFDLSSGANLYGGDRLRTYPVEIRGEDIWLDVAEPPFENRYKSILASLRDAFDDNSYDRMARELARLRKIEADPLDALREAINWSYERLEFGWTHAYAGMADWLRLYAAHDGDPDTQLACLLESIGHIADDVLREETYPYTGGAADYHEQAFVDAIEREDEAAAAAMIRGGVQAGLDFADFERGLARAALAHYNDFGHSLIYVKKAGRLAAILGRPVLLPLLLSLVREMIFATREDLIPEFQGYRAALKRWRETPDADAPGPDAWSKLSVNRALELAVASSSQEPIRLYEQLLAVNARNLLSFDIRQQTKVRIPVSGNVGWLDFTHGITFANAVRAQCSKYPELWPQGLLQMACFAGRNAAFTDRDAALDRWTVDDIDEFLVRAEAGLFDHGLDEFIVSVHVLKTLLAGQEEIRAASTQELASIIAAGLNRFMGSPLRRKQVRRTVHQAVSFVEKE